MHAGIIAIGITICILGGTLLVLFAIGLIQRYRKPWIYGTVQLTYRNQRSRKHRFKKNVQFVLRKAGEHGHKKDYWIDYESSWWDKFVPDKE